jgi:3-phenylpropionate/cinnamic acid dioxygenase small subunit
VTSTVDRETRQDIADLLVRYATGIDRRNWPLFRTCFTDDCEADYGEIGSWRGADAITAWMEETHAACGHTLHRISNQAVSQHDDRVTAHTYVDAIIMGPDNRTGVQAVGFYDDELARTADGWKIARRTFTMVLARQAGDVRP